MAVEWEFIVIMTTSEIKLIIALTPCRLTVRVYCAKYFACTNSFSLYHNLVKQVVFIFRFKGKENHSQKVNRGFLNPPRNEVVEAEIKYDMFRL